MLLAWGPHFGKQVSQSMSSQGSEALLSRVTWITRLGPLVKNAASWAPGLSIPFGGKGEEQERSAVCVSQRRLQPAVPGRMQRVVLFYLSVARVNVNGTSTFVPPVAVLSNADTALGL